jgi:hypothetical protein
MTEKYDSEDEFDVLWNEEVVETNETTREDEDEFVKSILGQPYQATENHPTPTPTRESEDLPDSQRTLQQIHDKYNKPYSTAGGKQIRIVKDDWGTFWHVEFMSGGQLPEELSGKFTDEGEADLAIRTYLNKQV